MRQRRTGSGLVVCKLLGEWRRVDGRCPWSRVGCVQRLNNGSLLVLGRLCILPVDMIFRAIHKGFDTPGTGLDVSWRLVTSFELSRRRERGHVGGSNTKLAMASRGG